MKNLKGVSITNPDVVVSLLKPYRSKRQEHFGILCLDAGRRLISKKVLFVGGEHTTVVDMKVVFWEAMKRKSSAIIVFHNHPSGNAEPSDYDIESTKRIYNACKIVGLPLLDHVIVAKDGYYSFVANGSKFDIEENINVYR